MHTQCAEHLNVGPGVTTEDGLGVGTEEEFGTEGGSDSVGGSCFFKYSDLRSVCVTVLNSEEHLNAKMNKSTLLTDQDIKRIMIKWKGVRLSVIRTLYKSLVRQ